MVAQAPYPQFAGIIACCFLHASPLLNLLVLLVSFEAFRIPKARRSNCFRMFPAVAESPQVCELLT